MNIEYFNSNGASIALNRGDYLVSTNDLRDFVWNYLPSNRPSGFGGRVKFSRPVQEKKLTIGIRGKTKEQFNINAKALMALTEIDILSNAPGKLYLGDQYLECYLAVSSVVNHYAYRNGWVSKELSVVVTGPFWNNETTQKFLAGIASEVSNPKRYNSRYPYRYISSTSSGTIENDHYAPCPMVITIYDAAVNPSITIGGNIYHVKFTSSNTQRIVIDQPNKEIYLQVPSGEKTNLFNYRDKENDVFRPAQPGTLNVVYDGSFDFDITIIKQRSEPTWI